MNKTDILEGEPFIESSGVIGVRATETRPYTVTVAEFPGYLSNREAYAQLFMEALAVFQRTGMTPVELEEELTRHEDEEDLCMACNDGSCAWCQEEARQKAGEPEEPS